MFLNKRILNEFRPYISFSKAKPWMDLGTVSSKRPLAGCRTELLGLGTKIHKEAEWCYVTELLLHKFTTDS